MTNPNLSETFILLTIIIPSFNCVDLLPRAVDSAFALGPEVVEVIVVDDGSTDSTPLTCERLVHKYPRLKVIRRVNGGLSAARNTGINCAEGKFIAFLDADDELIPFELGRLLEFDGDMLRIGVEEVSTSGEIRLWQEAQERMEGAVYVQNHLTRVPLYVPSWAYIYRKDFIIAQGLRFANGVIHEDMLFTVQALMEARVVAATPNLLYRYFRREGSITLQRSPATLKKRIRSLAYIQQQVLSLSNQSPHVDLWLWAAHITDYAWSFVKSASSKGTAWVIFKMELRLLMNYRMWGVWRSRKDVRWRLRVALDRLIAA